MDQSDVELVSSLRTCVVLALDRGERLEELRGIVEHIVTTRPALRVFLDEAMMRACRRADTHDPDGGTEVLRIVLESGGTSDRERLHYFRRVLKSGSVEYVRIFLHLVVFPRAELDSAFLYTTHAECIRMLLEAGATPSAHHLALLIWVGSDVAVRAFSGTLESEADRRFLEPFLMDDMIRGEPSMHVALAERFPADTAMQYASDLEEMALLCSRADMRVSAGENRALKICNHAETALLILRHPNFEPTRGLLPYVEHLGPDVVDALCERTGEARPAEGEPMDEEDPGGIWAGFPLVVDGLGWAEVAAQLAQFADENKAAVVRGSGALLRAASGNDAGIVALLLSYETEQRVYDALYLANTGRHTHPLYAIASHLAHVRHHRGWLTYPFYEACEKGWLGNVHALVRFVFPEVIGPGLFRAAIGHHIRCVHALLPYASDEDKYAATVMVFGGGHKQGEMRRIIMRTMTRPTPHLLGLCAVFDYHCEARILVDAAEDYTKALAPYLELAIAHCSVETVRLLLKHVSPDDAMSFANGPEMEYVLAARPDMRVSASGNHAYHVWGQQGFAVLGERLMQHPLFESEPEPMDMDMGMDAKTITPIRLQDALGGGMGRRAVEQALRSFTAEVGIDLLDEGVGEDGAHAATLSLLLARASDDTVMEFLRDTTSYYRETTDAWYAVAAEIRRRSSPNNPSAARFITHEMPNLYTALDDRVRHDRDTWAVRSILCHVPLPSEVKLRVLYTALRRRDSEMLRELVEWCGDLTPQERRGLIPVDARPESIFRSRSSNSEKLRILLSVIGVEPRTEWLEYFMSRGDFEETRVLLGAHGQMQQQDLVTDAVANNRVNIVREILEAAPEQVQEHGFIEEVRTGEMLRVFLRHARSPISRDGNVFLRAYSMNPAVAFLIMEHPMFDPDDNDNYEDTLREVLETGYVDLIIALLQKAPPRTIDWGFLAVMSVHYMELVMQHALPLFEEWLRIASPDATVAFPPGHIEVRYKYMVARRGVLRRGPHLDIESIVQDAGFGYSASGARK